MAQLNLRPFKTAKLRKRLLPPPQSRPDM